MTHRTFRDKAGLHWDVWEVKPSAAERRYLQRRIREEELNAAGERRTGKERRRSKISRTSLATEFARGWLCFECVDEKRRLAPVPAGWDTCDDTTLEQLCVSANKVARRKPDSEYGAGGAENIS